jgi:hypothetical protein
MPFSHHALDKGDEGQWFPSALHWTVCLLQSFEDNSEVLELARLPKLHPQTKHINIVNHHSCEAIKQGDIKILLSSLLAAQLIMTSWLAAQSQWPSG